MIADFRFRFAEPVVCTAIHHGHALAPVCRANMLLDAATRLREEDPRTGYFAQIAQNRIIARISRFQVDLNRPWERAVYRQPQDAWGLHVRKNPPTEQELAEAQALYTGFYLRTRLLLEELLRVFPRVFVFDLHSYNHMRQGPAGPPADAAGNPEVILGTSNMQDPWRPLIDDIEHDLKAYDYFGRSLDVRQDVKFTGGQFSRWLHYTFEGRVGCVALEFKKIFMDEWSGTYDETVMRELRRALAGTLPAVRAFLRNGC